MNYSIINDSTELSQFIYEFLPDLAANETFYVALFARNKYWPDCPSSVGQLKRFTSNKKNLYDKLKQLECPLGAYKVKGVSVPQEALALYITPNPRNFESAAKNGLISLVNRITKPYDGYNPHQDLMSAIQQSAGKKKWVQFDIDNPEINFDLINYIVGADAYRIIKTRGGYHVFVEAKKVKVEHAKNWYLSMKQIPGCDVSGDELTPIPGCIQGGFIPYVLR